MSLWMSSVGPVVCLSVHPSFTHFFFFNELWGKQGATQCFQAF